MIQHGLSEMLCSRISAIMALLWDDAINTLGGSNESGYTLINPTDNMKQQSALRTLSWHGI
jgi:hypothetical protein